MVVPGHKVVQSVHIGRRLSHHAQLFESNPGTPKISHVNEGCIVPRTEAKFLNEIQTKVLRVFLLAIQSHLYSFALRFMLLQLTQPLIVSTVCYCTL